MGVVHVITGTVCENRIHEVRLHLGREGILEPKTTGIIAGRLVHEVPGDPAVDRPEIGVDEQRTGGDRIEVRPTHHDPVFGLDAAHLGDGHDRTYRY